MVYFVFSRTEQLPVPLVERLASLKNLRRAQEKSS